MQSIVEAYKWVFHSMVVLVVASEFDYSAYFCRALMLKD